ncbi:MAG: DUF1987 domain-containing protein [Flavobacteriales bacterium]
MAIFKIEGTPKSPTVILDFETGLLELKGRSIPEDSIDFYAPIIESVNKYVLNPQPKTIVNIQLEYFNTSSSKCILDLFKSLESVARTNKEIIINWHYESDDEDMQEVGKDYQSIIKIPFKMIETEE